MVRVTRAVRFPVTPTVGIDIGVTVGDGLGVGAIVAGEVGVGAVNTVMGNSSAQFRFLWGWCCQGDLRRVNWRMDRGSLAAASYQCD